MGAQPVKRREPREGRDTHQENRHLRTFGNQEDDGDEQDDPDLEEERDPDEECRRRHRPGESLRGGLGEDRVDDLIGSPGLREELPDHGSQGDEHSDTAECGSDARGKSREGILEAHARCDCHDAGTEHEREERVHLHPDDENDDHDNGDEGGNDQSRGAGSGGGCACRADQGGQGGERGRERGGKASPDEGWNQGDHLRNGELRNNRIVGQRSATTSR